MGRERILGSLTALIGTLAVLAGCGGSGSPEPTADTALQRALASVADGPAGRSSFYFTDLGRLRRLGVISSRPNHGLPVDPRWERTTFGLGPLGLSPLAGRAVGLDAFSGSRAIQIGAPPRDAVRVDGTDTSGVGAALTKAGATRSSSSAGDVYSVGAEGQVQTAGPLARGSLVTIADRVFVGADVVALSGFESTLAEAEGGNSSLGTAPSIADASSCLGDAIAAGIIAPPRSFRLPAEVVGVGVTAPPHGDASGPVHEVLCAVTGSADEAARVEAAMKRGFAAGRIDPVTGAPLRTYVSAAAIDQPEPGVARASVVLTPKTPPGFLYAALQNATIGGYLGAPGAPDQRRPPPNGTG